MCPPHRRGSVITEQEQYVLRNVQKCYRNESVSCGGLGGLTALPLPPARADQVSGDLSQAHGAQGTDGLCLRVSGIEERSHKTLSCLHRLRSCSTLPGHHQPIPVHVKTGVCDIHLLSEPHNYKRRTLDRMLYRSRTENNIHTMKHLLSKYVFKQIVIGLEYYYKLEEFSPNAQILMFL